MKVITTIIRDAKKLIQERGWVRGSLCSREGFCIVGAIIALEESEEVRELVFDCIRKASGCHLITKWNDSIARDKHHVIQILEKAIRVAEKILTEGKPRMAGPERGSNYS